MEADAPNQESDAAGPPPVNDTDVGASESNDTQQVNQADGDSNTAAEDPPPNGQGTDNQEPQSDASKEQQPDSNVDQQASNNNDPVTTAQTDSIPGEEPKNLTDDAKDPSVDANATEQAAESVHQDDKVSDESADKKNSDASESAKPDADKQQVVVGGVENQPKKEDPKAKKEKSDAVPEKGQKPAGKDAAKEKKLAPVKRGGKDNKSEVTHEKSLGDEVDLPEVHAVEISSDPKMDKEMRTIISDMSREKDWIIRASALRKFQSIVAGGAVGTSNIFLKAIKGSDFAICVQALFSENRSHLVKETADAFTRLAEAVQSQGGTAGDEPQKNRLVKDYEGILADVVLAEALKTAVKTNVVISSAADACIRSLISNVHSPKLLRIIVEPLMDARANTKMRQFCSDYLVIVLQSWPVDKFDKQSYLQDPSKNSNVNNTKSKVELTDAIEQGIRTCLSDAVEQTRANGRTALQTYESLFPDRSAKLRENLTRQQARILNEDAGPKTDAPGMGVHVRVYVCMHMCVYACVCVCVYIYIYER
jgi:hypothetical protein